MVSRPLTELIRKDKKFAWTTPCQKAFDLLKAKFTEAPILVHLDPAKATVIETDATAVTSPWLQSSHRYKIMADCTQ